MKYLIILILPIIISCNINSGNIADDNLRKYNISDELLAEGLVKKFIFKSPKDTTYIYDKIIRQNDTIISKRYNDKFLLVRHDLNKINKNDWTLISRVQIGTDRKRYNQEIILPYINSFNPKDRILESIYQYAPIEGDANPFLPEYDKYFSNRTKRRETLAKETSLRVHEHIKLSNPA
jgi:hypothetical protein